MGIEPTYTAWKAVILPLNYTRIIDTHRGDRIRTCDPLVPNQELYQTEPHPGNPLSRNEFARIRYNSKELRLCQDKKTIFSCFPENRPETDLMLDFLFGCFQNPGA